ncbi:hypothetical protein SADUNF_Sadunf10G0056500 [Salix dunnii]|uniref:Uncharacterized protein n=1 Tax=Salix dunnii TaxID=1413687 RepID=A0A835JV61_9ROSI|nr:hypothetical protein SADUNF_Sadunf10G0056500 [Salix dunnii]
MLLPWFDEPDGAPQLHDHISLLMHGWWTQRFNWLEVSDEHKQTYTGAHQLAVIENRLLCASQ